MKNIFIFTIVCLLNINFTYSQCDITHNPSILQNFTNPIPHLWGQGFIAECDGYLEYVQLTSVNAGTISAGTLKIYSGNGVSSTPIYTQAYSSIIINQANDFITINLTQSLFLTMNNQYTFEFTVDNGVSAVGGSNEYSGGTLWQDTHREFPDYDFLFSVSISNNTLSITEVSNNSKITFPNPSSETIQISGLATKENYMIYSLLGAEIKSGNISNNETIDIENFTNGVYLLKFGNGNTIKFIKE